MFFFIKEDEKKEAAGNIRNFFETSKILNEQKKS